MLVLPFPHRLFRTRLRCHVEQAGRGAVAEFLACAQRILVPVGFGEGVRGFGGVVDRCDGGGEDEGGELWPGVAEGGAEDRHGAANGGDDEVVPCCQVEGEGRGDVDDCCGALVSWFSGGLKGGRRAILGVVVYL